MASIPPKITMLCNRDAYDRYIGKPDWDRLTGFAEPEWVECSGAPPQSDEQETERLLAQRIGDAAALVLCGGAPRVTASLMARLPALRIVGDMDGDRFAHRIDMEAAWERGLRVVDTTNGTSYPVAEWALAMMIICLRNAGMHFRGMISGKTSREYNERGYLDGDLTGKTVGLIGCGHIGRRLIKFLKPFETPVFVFDPYLPREMADALGFTLTSLDNVLTKTQVIVCLAPITPKTQGMIGVREIALIPSGAVFVNVSRGAIVDSNALIERLRRGDIVAGLDVFDPEPVPPDSELLSFSNVFLSPHIAGVTAPSYPRMFTLMVDELDRFFSGHEPYFELLPRSIANRRGVAVGEVGKSE
ncbi:MAG: hydroxyacid dehydrogenase [candidate division Zixibacteria bacterium]|nr:hydroxyacid dehydrogenase [candidate division Zixibacteria bacterium]